MVHREHAFVTVIVLIGIGRVDNTRCRVDKTYEVEPRVWIDGAILARKLISGPVLQFQDDGHLLVVVRLQHQGTDAIAGVCLAIVGLINVIVDEHKK